MYRLHVATIAIIAANVLVSLKGFNDTGFFDRYKFSIAGIKAGQKERALTSGFLHVDIAHLFFNMFTLYFFADVVISWFGPVNFIVIYIISLLAGNLLSISFHKDEPYYSAVGASGAVTGILYAAILLQPYSIYGMKNRVGNIGHSAHFGGAIGGYVTALIFMPSLLQTDTLVVVLLALPILVLFALEKSGKLK